MDTERQYLQRLERPNKLTFCKILVSPACCYIFMLNAVIEQHSQMFRLIHDPSNKTEKYTLVH